MQGRNLSLDVTRIVAIAAVIMIHASATAVLRCELGSVDFLWANVLDSVAHLGVPLFVMTSGALLLDEERPFSLKGLFCSRIPRTLALLFFWSAFYALIMPFLTGRTFNPAVAIRSFFLGATHLWYLYMQIGLYLALPFLRAFVKRKRANARFVLLYVVISVSVQFLVLVLQAAAKYYDFAKVLIAMTDSFGLNFFRNYIAYFLAGWYIANVGISREKRRLLYAAAFFSIVVIILYVAATKDVATGYFETNALMFCYSCGVFAWLNSLCLSPGKRARALIESISRLAFGMYILHVALLLPINIAWPITTRRPFCVLLTFAFVFAASLALSWGVTKIPILKKTLRG